jgi:hypothetical protein
MPASSSRRQKKAWSVSPYWTRYSSFGYAPRAIFQVGLIDHSPSSLSTISGMVWCWKTRFPRRWVSSHSAGTMVSWYVERPLVEVSTRICSR